MDADKLDYLARDAYFAGPTVVYDLDRFLHTVDAIEYPRCGPTAEEPTVARLSIPIEGVTALEQIIISKLMLFSYLYHHHKIRCVEGMCHEALARCMEVSKRHPRAKTYPRLDHPVSFLSHSDRSLFPVSWPPPVMGDKVAGELFSMLARRELYKRALIISRLFLLDLDANDHAKFGFERLLGYGTDAAGRGELRQHIFEVAKKEMGSRRHREAAKGLLRRFRPHHVIVDIPRSPTVEETEAVMVPVLAEGTRGAHHANQDFVPLSDIFPIEKWVDAYNAIKWRGHVFAVDEAVRFVNAAARAVLAAPPYNLQFTYQATDLCKLDEPIPLPPAIGRSLLAGV
jgi:HD superfamily phosphohydrolase